MSNLCRDGRGGACNRRLRSRLRRSWSNMPTGLIVTELEGVDIMVLGRRARCGHGTMPPAFKKTKHCQEDTEMAPPSPPGKRRRITVLEAIVVIGGFIAIIGY